MTDSKTTFETLKSMFNNSAAATEQPEEVIQVDTHMPMTNIIDRQPNRVNLVNYAKRQAKYHNGHASQMINLYQEIRCGHLIDETSDQVSQEKQQAAMELTMINIQKQVQELEGEQKKIVEVAVPSLKRIIVSHEDELYLLDIEKHQPKVASNMDSFNKKKCGWLTILGLIYLCVFYISAFYMGVTRDLMADAQQNADAGQAGLGAVFSIKAFTTLGFHLVSPILILMFAFVFDNVLENEDRNKRAIYGIVTGLIVLVLDALIAYKIHHNNQKIGTMMGIDDLTSWYASDDFWIVLFMGFVGALFWSYILKLYKQELAKTDVSLVIELKKKHINGKIELLKKDIETLEAKCVDVLTKIKQLNIDLKVVLEQKKACKDNLPELHRLIMKINDGWMQFVEFDATRDWSKRRECETAHEAFVNEYIKSPKLTLQTNN